MDRLISLLQFQPVHHTRSQTESTGTIPASDQTSKFCPGSVWDSGAINICVNDRILHFAVPIITVLISVIILILSTHELYDICNPFKSRRRYSFIQSIQSSEPNTDDLENSLDQDESLFRLDSNNGNESFFDISNRAVDDDDDDENFNGSTSATTSSYHVPIDGIPSNIEDTDLIMIPMRSIGILTFLETGFVALFVGYYTVVLILHTTSSKLRQNQPFLRYKSWAALCLWIYMLAFHRLRRRRMPNGLSTRVSVQLAVIYFSQWTIALVQYHLFFMRGAVFNMPFVFATFEICLSSGLCVISLLLPIGIPPPYVEVTHGLSPWLEQSVSLFSRLSFSWTSGLLKKGYSKPIKTEDVWDLSEDLRSIRIVQEFRDLREQYSFQMALLHFCAFDLGVGSVWAASYALICFVPTIMVQVILSYLESDEATTFVKSCTFIAILFLSTLLGSIVSAQSLWSFRRLGLKVKSLLIAEIYSKALSRPFTAEQEAENVSANGTDSKKLMSTGAITNLMAVDSEIITEAIAGLDQFVQGVIMIVVSLTLLYLNLGPSAFAGIFLMCSLLPINYLFSLGYAAIQKDLMAVTDNRIRAMTEVFQSIKIIKLFAWESMFQKKILDVRTQELHYLRKRYILWAVSVIVWFGFPTLITFASFGSFTLLAKHELKPSVAFSSLALFNLLRTPMTRLASMVAMFMGAKVSFGRITQFMCERPTLKYEQLSVPQANGVQPYIGFVLATCQWPKFDNSTTFTLKDLNVDFKVGELTLICGPTGSGKSSLLLALLGEMDLIEGRIMLPGGSGTDALIVDSNTSMTESVAYCSQQAWILDGTVKSNILFGSGFEQTRYDQVIKACSLQRDFKVLASGDETQVGDKGVVLSGGQKQRIALARAIYSNARHLLLDDCLSAVDAPTAKELYNNALTGELMRNRTCILISHNVSLALSRASYVVAVKDGKIEFQGTPAEGLAYGFLEKYLQTSNTEASEIELSVERGPDEDQTKGKSGPNQVVEEGSTLESENREQGEEPTEVGQVKLSVYIRYFRAMGMVIFWAVTSSIILAHQIGFVAQSWWIREWSKADEAIADFIDALVDLSRRHGVVYYLLFYGLISLIYIGLSFLRESVVFYGGLHASKTLFEQMLHKLLHFRVRFFEVTPSGRIINRFSKDMEAIDQVIAPDLLSFAHSVLALVVVIVLISIILPGFLIAGIGISVIFYVINIYYIRSTRELKRIQSISRSPIYQHFAESLTGLATIRAYGCERRFIYDSMSKVDMNSRPYGALLACNRWMALRIEICGGLVGTFTSIFLLLGRRKVDAGLAGLCLTFAMTFTDNMLWLVMLSAINEMNMNAVERVNEYLEQNYEEAPAETEYHAPDGWPQEGRIEVDHLTVRYAFGLPRALDNVSFCVSPGQKVGVVGRTGAGKSTLASVFFRFLEAESGKIVIDGLDISKMGLRELRSALTIIPQDPTLFSGTIRSNLDPFDNYRDREIRSALCRAHLLEEENDRLSNFYDLDSSISGGGSNLSQGQRQLLCLARSLLKNPRVIILDEATASIDYETDQKLQMTIRRELRSSTVITIAHRLRSIIDYDAILVMDNGKIIEHGTPMELISKDGSLFRSMCANSGEFEELELLARASVGIS
ncbi:uncharacterized protein V1516DRAFT_629966 [Lipomyces oligophaga]|uniref:uncharacterized protein n=1 Tax=Lipomyces oligophaga TaxID=45792 RepID=UPI0034CE9D0F